MSTNSISIGNLRNSISHSTISQERLARALGIEPTQFSRILRGLRPMPEDLPARIHAALDRLERAEQAAQEARERVLAEAEAEQPERVLAEGE